MLHRFPLLLVASALALCVGVTGVLISLPAQAGPPPPVTVRDTASLRDNGRTLTLTTRAVEGVALVETQSADREPGPGILAASPDGLTVAFTPVGPGQMGPLGLAHADGTQIEVAIPGVRGAAFVPTGGWLAVVDNAGALWRVDQVSGEAALLADGPFGSDLTVLPDGGILALHLSSVEAPYWAAAEVVAVDGSESVVGSLAAQDQLVYQAGTLPDGAFVLARHRNDGGLSVVRVATDGSETPLTGLDRGTIVDLSPVGDRLALADAGTIWLKQIGNGPPPRAIGAGSAARFSPDGTLLLLFGTDTTGVVDVNGSRLTEAGSSSCWLGGGRGCRP